MQTVEEIYTKSVRPLSQSDQRKLASMILERVAKEAGSERTRQKGGIREAFGMWKGKGITKEEYLKLDHNDRIDFDLRKAYADSRAGQDEFSEKDWLKAASGNDAFDFLGDEGEDIYTLEDGKPLTNEI